MTVIKIVTLVTSINFSRVKYNYSKIFIDSKKSEYDISNKDNTIENDNIIDK